MSFAVKKQYDAMLETSIPPCWGTRWITACVSQSTVQPGSVTHYRIIVCEFCVPGKKTHIAKVRAGRERNQVLLNLWPKMYFLGAFNNPSFLKLQNVMYRPYSNILLTCGLAKSIIPPKRFAISRSLLHSHYPMSLS